MAKPEAAWQTALGELQLQMTKASFDTWLQHSHVVAHEDGTFIIGVQNSYVKEWLDKRLAGIIKRTLTGIVGRSVELKFVIQTDLPPPADVEILQPIKAVPGQTQSSEETSKPVGSQRHADPPHRLTANPDYTFAQFIVGSSNRLAHAAALAVTEKPAQNYNPLFLYGGVGLGKTHLMQAIGHQAATLGYRTLYVSSETFVNDLINAIRTQSQEQFRDRYRTVDFLMIDDIQFIAGKESTQEEFFHTFNDLHSSGKQIIMTSDRPPQAIPTLEERLSSRFQWGLIADIQQPDLEMRMAILQCKAKHRQARLPDDVMYLIARQMKNSIRELEGGLNRVLAFASLTNESVTLELARQALSSLVGREICISLDDIVDAVSSHFGIQPEDLTGTSRRKEFVVPRQLAMYLAREETPASLPQIGQALGGRDHTTVMHGSQKMATQIEKENVLRRELTSIRHMLYRELA